MNSSKSSVAPSVVSWVLSLGSLIGGIALFMYGKSETVTAQAGANDGTIADATEYYTRITNGDASVTLATALIAAGIVGLIITLSQYSKNAVVFPAQYLSPNEDSVAESAVFDEAPEVDEVPEVDEKPEVDEAPEADEKPEVDEKPEADRDSNEASKE